MLTFNAIDVETANPDLASICQIGIVHVRNGEIFDQWQSLINPEDWFDPRNVGIHGIDEHDVQASPTLPDVRDELRHRLRGSVLVSHMAFDRVAFERAMTRYELEQLQVTWLDSATIARRTWPDRYGRRGYGLKNISNDLGISLKHHDALEDARAAAQIVLCACAISATDIQGWLERTARLFLADLLRVNYLKDEKGMWREPCMEKRWYSLVRLQSPAVKRPIWRRAPDATLYRVSRRILR